MPHIKQIINKITISPTDINDICSCTVPIALHSIAVSLEPKTF